MEKHNLRKLPSSGKVKLVQLLSASPTEAEVNLVATLNNTRKKSKSSDDGRRQLRVMMESPSKTL